jgi:hypothetical protein
MLIREDRKHIVRFKLDACDLLEPWYGKIPG